MMKIVEDSRRFVAAVFAVAVDTAVDTAVFVVVAATVVDTAVDIVVDTAIAADTPAVFAATVADTAIAADTVVAVVANHSKNYKIAQKSDRETHNLHDWFRTTQYAC